MNDSNKNLTKEIQSEVFEMLIKHLQSKTEVQNIDLMNLADFCRNCLWNAIQQMERLVSERGHKRTIRKI